MEKESGSVSRSGRSEVFPKRSGNAVEPFRERVAYIGIGHPSDGDGVETGVSRSESSEPLCPRRHPHGPRVKFRLQALSDRNGHQAGKPSRLFCPWCDWKRLRESGRDEADDLRNVGSDLR